MFLERFSSVIAIPIFTPNRLRQTNRLILREHSFHCSPLDYARQFDRFFVAFIFCEVNNKLVLDHEAVASDHETFLRENLI